MSASKAKLDSACIFCRIVAGEVPAKVVCDRELALAFLDISPLADGHTMVIAKTHGQHVADLDGAHLAAVMETVGEVTRAMREGLGAEATTIGINDGVAAGQMVPHMHVHIVPRFAGDGGGTLHSLMGTRGSKDLDASLARLRTALGAAD